MSLRIRLILLIVLVVTVVSFALSALYLDSLVNSLSTAAIERSSQASQQVNAFVLDRLNRDSPAVQPQPPDPESARRMERRGEQRSGYRHHAVAHHGAFARAAGD